MFARTFFDMMVVEALEAAPKNTMTVAELRKASKIRRGITSHLADMRLRGLASWRGSELSMETEVSLACG